MIGSYTLFADFENCPKRCYHTRVAKDVSQEKTPALELGIAVHEALERRLRDGTPLPEQFAAYEEHAKRLDPQRELMRIEWQVGMKRDGAACDFFDQKAWFRGKLDIAVFVGDARVAYLLDWKTGKKREDPRELECQALLLWCNAKSVETISGRYFWLREGKEGQKYDLSPPVGAWKWVDRTSKAIETAENENNWPAQPNPLCGWCPVRQCEHNRRRK